MSILRYLTWFVRLFLFLVLLLFALKNTQSVRLVFLFDTGWDIPLIVLLFAFFAAGAVLGAMACLGVMIRQRRTIGSFQRELQRRAAGRPAAPSPLPPDTGI